MGDDDGVAVPRHVAGRHHDAVFGRHDLIPRVGVGVGRPLPVDVDAGVGPHRPVDGMAPRRVEPRGDGVLAGHRPEEPAAAAPAAAAVERLQLALQVGLQVLQQPLDFLGVGLQGRQVLLPLAPLLGQAGQFVPVAGHGGVEPLLLPLHLGLEGHQLPALRLQLLLLRHQALPLRLDLGHDVQVMAQDLAQQVQPGQEVGKAVGLEQDLQHTHGPVLLDGADPPGHVVLPLFQLAGGLVDLLLLGVDAGLGVAHLLVELRQLDAGLADLFLQDADPLEDRGLVLLEGSQLALGLGLALLQLAQGLVGLVDLLPQLADGAGGTGPLGSRPRQAGQRPGHQQGGPEPGGDACPPPPLRPSPAHGGLVPPPANHGTSSPPRHAQCPPRMMPGRGEPARPRTRVPIPGAAAPGGRFVP